MTPGMNFEGECPQRETSSLPTRTAAHVPEPQVTYSRVPGGPASPADFPGGQVSLGPHQPSALKASACSRASKAAEEARPERAFLSATQRYFMSLPRGS